MPCDHKFKEDLDLEKIDFELAVLIVGTFNPAWPATNTSSWFYGRTDTNYFWDVLPRLYGEESLINAGPSEWKHFCHDHKIALTDLISSIDDAEQDNKEHAGTFVNFPDKAIAHNFDDFTFTDIVGILRRHPSIRNVYLTRGITEAFWKHAWNPVTRYCNLNDIRVRTLLTPSVDAGYQHGAHNFEHPGDEIPSLADYILMKWKQEWHFNP